MHKLFAAVAVLAPLLCCADSGAARTDRPSRPPGKGCAWEKLANASIGLAAWVQRCDYGFRKIDFVFQGNALAIRYSDGGAPDPLIEVLELNPGEPAQAGIRRLLAERTEREVAARCVVAIYRREKSPAGAARYTFVPNAAYRKELKASASPDEVGDPPCGDWGDAPDGIQYFEVHPASKARKVLFVRVGQDEPLFDEKTLRLLAPAAQR